MNEDDGRVVVILTALEVEYLAVRPHFEELVPTPVAGTIFEVGRLPGSPGRVVLAVTGSGTQGAAVLAERAITVFGPRALLFVGVAGALYDGITIGDVVVATKVYGYHGGEATDEGFNARPNAWQAPYELEQLARYVARTESWAPSPAVGPVSNVLFRPIAAGEVVLDSRTNALAVFLRKTFNDAAAIEMEGSGAALAGHLNRATPVLVIRGISDQANGAKVSADAGGSQALAAGNAAAFAATLTAKILGVGAAVPNPAGER